LPDVDNLGSIWLAELQRIAQEVSARAGLAEDEAAVPRICRDPHDDWVIACAVVGKADVIVSGDRDLLDLERVGDIPILTAGEYLTRLQSS
jgi:predicted nucleic acid-binding protein